MSNNLLVSKAGEQSRAIPGTDLDNSRQFAERFSERIRYSSERRNWMSWNGAKWTESGEVAAMHLARQMAEDVQSHQLMSASGLKRMLSLARSEPTLALPPWLLDADPWSLTVQNGILNLRTGAFEERSGTALVSKVGSVAFDPNAKCPMWTSFIQTITSGDPELAEYIQRFFGYCLTGRNSEHIFHVFWGHGANGKSTLVNTVRKLLGDYGVNLPADTFLQKRVGAPTNDLAMLEGARLALCDEPNKLGPLDEARIKSVTGGDDVAARRLYQEYREFTPVAKLVLTTNFRPQATPDDGGLFRRLRMVPFTHRFTPDQDIKGYGDELLRNESAGILNWLVDGCLAWQRVGLEPPLAVRLQTEQYRKELDPVATFIEEMCDTGDGLYVPAAQLFNAFSRWCRTEGAPPIGLIRFRQLMLANNIARERRAAGVRYLNIHPKPS
jgi:putative DNA primase/helicase